MRGVYSVYNSVEGGLQQWFEVNDPVFHMDSCSDDNAEGHLKQCPDLIKCSSL